MAKQKTAEELITQFNAESEQETVADESTLQTSTPDEVEQAIQRALAMSHEAIIDLVGSIPTNQEELDALHAAYAAKLVKQEAERAALDAQDPIIYRYNGNAAAGESMAHVPLADIRQSLWNELEPYMRAGVEASKLYTKAEV